MNNNPKKGLWLALIVLIIVGIGVGSYLIFFQGKNATESLTSSPKPEEKTERVVTAKAKDFTDSMKFRDYRAQYRLLDDKTRLEISEDEYVKRQEWLDKNTVAGASDIKEVKLGTPTLNGDSAEVRTTLVTTTGEYNDMLKFVYENGKWHKLFQGGEAISIGKTWDEFVSANQMPTN